MLTKKQQTQRKHRLRPQYDVHKEPKYLSWLHSVEMPSCFVCETRLGIQMHHIKECSSDAKKDNEVIPLCHEHHLGNKFSVHGTAKQFREIYSVELQREYARLLYFKYKGVI